MERFCQGDTRGLELLYGRHAAPVQSFLRSMVRDTALAEDLVQVTFMSVLRSPDRFEPGNKVSNWLFAIAANAARDALRRRGRSPEELAKAGAPPADISVEPQVEDAGLKRAVEAALQQLPVSHREAVVLHKVQGLSFDEIAKSLGISSTAARLRAHRGYEKLRELLADVEKP